MRVIFSTSEPFAPPSCPRWRAIAEGARSYLVSREAQTLLDCWLAAGSDDRPPARADLHPEAMPRILADIWLMDYEPAGTRLRYRLAGEHIRARYDFPLVGRYLDQIVAAEARDTVLAYFRACVELPAVSIVAGRLYHEWERPGYGERLLLPLIAADGTPEGLIGITICRQTFPSRPVAEIRAKRVTSILPLDGSPASEEAG
ncbi:MAG: hypothetical protein Kow00114_00240 [Kiloniellaceae bacterium]